MNSIRLDPRMFISGPYIECPKCAKKSFGVLIIDSQEYRRRCRECFFPGRKDPPATYPLPKLNKKVIYVDQFAISNMMKILNPKTKSYQKGSIGPFWLRLFERLDSLCKMQLIICPDSPFHTHESLVSPYFKPLRQMYELLSNDVSFFDYDTIQRFQIYDHAMNWINGKGEEEPHLDIYRIVHGKINGWQDKFLISVEIESPLDIANCLRIMRKHKNTNLNAVFERWRSEKNKTFNDWFEEESMAFGRVILKEWAHCLAQFVKISSGHVEPTAHDILPTPSSILIYSLSQGFKEVGIQDCDVPHKIIEYLTSSYLKYVPFNKISSMLYAALARKAAAGRKKPPNQGTTNDIEILSGVLPYCDAMFIDNECHSYLKEMPLCEAIDYKTAVFSQNSKDQFLEYLNGIEFKAPREHLQKLDEVYGKNWKEPYKMLYKTSKP